MRWLSFLAVLVAITACKANDDTVSCPLAAHPYIQLDELPRGSCSGAGSCGYSVYPCGGSYEGTGLIDGYTCTCASGTWDCKVTSPGASYCGDAGVGASDSGACDSAAAVDAAGGMKCVHDPAAAAPLPATASDVLPVGACAPSDVACDPIVRVACCGSMSDSIRTYYHCECACGAWACTLTDEDSSVCPQNPSDCPDAGSD